MRPGWKVGSIFGIPLLIHSSWFFILALFTLGYRATLNQQGFSDSVAWAVGLLSSLLLFLSVLLHELGHSLVARSQGIPVNSITLFLFGGIASIDEESKTPGQAFQVAIAGPTVSFCLFLGLTVLGQVIDLTPSLDLLVTNLASINLLLAMFNMIPGLPLDGGQVLKAAIWKLTGSRLKGMRWAARAGQLLGWTAFLLGFGLFLQTWDYGLLWIAVIGWFVVNTAGTYSRVADLQEAVAGLQASSAMTRDFRVVDANLSLHAFTNDYLLREDAQLPAFFASSDGRYRGLIEPDDLQQIERSQWEVKALNDIVHPLTEIPTVQEPAPLSEVIDQLETLKLKRITVLSPAGAVAGVIDRGDIVRAVAEKLKVPVPDALIKRIKEEGTYPPGLPLQAIAKSIGDSA